MSRNEQKKRTHFNKEIRIGLSNFLGKTTISESMGKIPYRTERKKVKRKTFLLRRRNPKEQNVQKKLKQFKENEN